MRGSWTPGLGILVVRVGIVRHLMEDGWKVLIR